MRRRLKRLPHAIQGNGEITAAFGITAMGCSLSVARLRSRPPCRNPFQNAFTSENARWFTQSFSAMVTAEITKSAHGGKWRQTVPKATARTQHSRRLYILPLKRRFGPKNAVALELVPQ